MENGLQFNLDSFILMKFIPHKLISMGDADFGKEKLPKLKIQAFQHIDVLQYKHLIQRACIVLN